MKQNLKKAFIIQFFILGMMFMSGTMMAQSGCCTSKTDKNANSKNDVELSNNETSGCAPSSCRGAKTKFGEAKVISNLREQLVSLKAAMEKSQKTTFSARSYDLHNIIGDSDEESLAIIQKEVKLIEKEFASKLNHQFTAFQLPTHKAKQIGYLKSRIGKMQGLL